MSSGYGQAIPEELLAYLLAQQQGGQVPYHGQMPPQAYGAASPQVPYEASMPMPYPGIMPAAGAQAGTMWQGSLMSPAMLSFAGASAKEDQALEEVQQRAKQEETVNLDDEFARAIWKSVEESYRALSLFREARMQYLREYVGPRYGQDTISRKLRSTARPLNFFEMGVNTLKSLLLGGEPRVTVVAKMPTVVSFAPRLEIAINALLKRLNIIEDVRLAFVESLFGLGIIKIGIAPAQIQDNDEIDFGDYYADYVSFEDFVFDASATRIDKALYYGNRYIMSADQIMTHTLLSDEARNRLIDRINTTKPDDEGGSSQEFSASLSGLRQRIGESLDKHVILWDVWLRKENILITYLEGDPRPVLVRPFQGPRTGPYRLLYYFQVPKNAIPLTLGDIWYDNHRDANILMNKFITQALRYKKVLAVAGTQQVDGRQLVEASDGEAVTVMDPASARELILGGGDQSVLAAANILRQLSNIVTGNIELLAGLGPQSPTLGQDQILANNATERLRYMRTTVLSFLEGIAADLAQWIWNDPFYEARGSYRIPGTEIVVPLDYNYQDRLGDIEDYGFEVIPSTIAHRSPGERMQQLVQVVNNFIAPMMPMLQQEGLQLSAAKFVSYLARYLNLPELMDILSPGKIVAQSPQQIYTDQIEMPRGGLHPVTSDRASHVAESGIDQIAQAIANMTSPGNEAK